MKLGPGQDDVSNTPRETGIHQPAAVGPRIREFRDYRAVVVALLKL